MIPKTCSELIALMRFPLMVGVVCIHTDLRIVRPDLNDLPLFAELMSIFIDFVCSASVPLFFFFAGYLFVMTMRERSFLVHLRRRMQGIVVPYVLWIALCLMIVAACQWLKPGFSLLLHKPVGEFGVKDVLWMFWDISRSTGLAGDQHGPLVGQFWFLQCLMVQMIVSPVLLWLARHAGIFTALLLFIVYAWGFLPQAPGIHAGALFYYFAGLLCAMSKPDFTRPISRYGWAALPVFVVLYTCKHHLMPSLPDALWAVQTILMATCELWLALKWLNLRQRSGRPALSPTLIWMASGSFFVFAAHRFLTAVLTNMARNLLIPLGNSLQATATYLLGSAAVVVLCTGAFALLRRYMPRTLDLFTGGRIVPRA